jgi:hypothetical protein
VKHQYNQGDLLQFTWSGGRRQILVITEVFDDTYKSYWFGTGGVRNTHNFEDLDDNDRATLLVRGQ